MRAARGWPVWGKVLAGALTLYSVCLCWVGVSVLVMGVRAGWALKAGDVVLQILMLVFLPVMLLGLWRTRLASGLLFAGAAVDLGLLLTLTRSTGDGSAGAMVGSVAFLGGPMLAGAVVYQRLSRLVAAG